MHPGIKRIGYSPLKTGTRRMLNRSVKNRALSKLARKQRASLITAHRTAFGPLGAKNLLK